MLKEAPLLKVEGLCRGYGYKQILRGVDLHLRPGEVVCLMGENGAGKTTLIDTLLSRLEPDRGSVEFRGKKLETAEDRADFIARSAVLGHDAGIFPDLTGAENLESFYRAYFGALDDHGRERIQGLLKRVGLAARREDLARTYSRGMRQRLGLCRILLHSPEVLFLDEPLTALDVSGVALFFDILKDFRSEGAALVVTHDALPFRKIASRFIHLTDGRIGRVS